MTLQSIRILKYLSVVFLAGTLWQTLPATAADVEKQGTAYVVYLSGDLDFREVVDHLKTEILAANWEITDVQDIDVGLTQYGMKTQNKVISACKSQLLAQAIKDDPYISLAVPCRFTAFRDEAKKQIVVGFQDPAAEAKALNIGQYRAAEQATDELKRILKTIAEFFKER